jgi:GTP-binding protein
MGDHETHGAEAGKVAGLDSLDLESGRRLFAGDCSFIAGADSAAALPHASLPEVAFVGRSNAGKSSLINALAGRKSLARTAKRPGRTQQLNFFRVGGKLVLVDMPGYGFARVSKTDMAAWRTLIATYLRNRTVLRRILLLIDARRGLMPADREALDVFDAAAVIYQAILTKTDEVDAGALTGTIAAVGQELARRPAAHPQVLATSAASGYGIAELRAELAALAELG